MSGFSVRRGFVNAVSPGALTRETLRFSGRLGAVSPCSIERNLSGSLCMCRGDYKDLLHIIVFYLRRVAPVYLTE
ncbi:hypothetical protein chiPu_0020066 [Chiloscyllium punctatum]|uniref:Uncharacterized protein n=1 Tax=Chiloscyllium punctatum TaxID=137246 RepID=A0A401RU00_CHIPU|nr:hypothetical protein [Chiloscyllium punctatum]